MCLNAVALSFHTGTLSGFVLEVDASGAWLEVVAADASSVISVGSDGMEELAGPDTLELAP